MWEKTYETRAGWEQTHNSTSGTTLKAWKGFVINWPSLVETFRILQPSNSRNLFHIIVPYILKSNLHPNLIRTSFCQFLKRKKLVRGSNPHLSFNRPLRTVPSEVARWVSAAWKAIPEHYRQIFQEVLHKQCFGRIRRWHSMGAQWWR